jgi:diguanylate cyclase (GGDEF)-like protein
MSGKSRHLPLSEALPRHRGTTVRVLAAVVSCALALEVALVAAGAATRAVAPLAVVVLLGGGILVLARVAFAHGERGIWLAAGAALVLAAAGGAYAAVAFADASSRPVPSPADALALGSYVLAYVGFTLLLRTRVQRCPGSVWLDGLLGMLCVAAVGAALVFEPLAERSSGGLAAVATNLAFPLLDLLMVALAVGAFILTGFRPGRPLALLVLGMSTLGVADMVFLLEAPDGAQPSPIVTVLWSVPGVLAMLAAWQRTEQVPARTDGWPVMVPPVGFALAALALLVYGNLSGIGRVALGLAAAAVITATVRMVLTLTEVRALAESRRQALTDDLTGLPNRRAFQRELEHATREAQLEGTSLGLMILDLDGFKELNDTLGHHAGDLVLEQLGPRLRGAVRGGDFLARLGGDEFAVLMPLVNDGDAAMRAAERVRAAVRAGFALAEMTIHVDASAGVALLGEHASTGSLLLQRADIAMYQAKAEYAGSRMYEAARDRHSRDRLELTGQLRDAIRDGELIVHFQPKASMATREPVGLEALVRWQHPERGLVPPSEFIPLAEQTGLMRPLTLLVLKRALEVQRRLRARGDVLTVAVNIAAANLLDTEFPGAVGRLLHSSGTDPSQLVLEITENSVMTDPERGETVLRELCSLGVELALDDFGTGYSSLGYLTRLPVSELKIDRSFVMNLGEHSNEAIVGAVADLARNLGLRLVAEGIEDAETWDRLRDYGCDQAQGFYLAKPLPEPELVEWLDARRTKGDPGPDAHLEAAWASLGQRPAAP